MEPEILLAQLHALLERAPNFDQYSPASREHGIWLGQAHAFISRWDRLEAISLKVASDSLAFETLRPTTIGNIFGVLYRAIADLELKVPNKSQIVFAAGKVYDLFKGISNIIETAEKSILIVDPYLDRTVFDYYLNSKKPQVQVRLLLNNDADNVKIASQKYIQQHGEVLEVRKSGKLHDRVIFVDGYVCWVIGQSLKDAAKAKPTYLVPLAPDVVSAKLQEYEAIWSDSIAI